MTEIKIRYNKTKSNPFTLEINQCDGVEELIKRVSFGPTTLKAILEMGETALMQHKSGAR